MIFNEKKTKLTPRQFETELERLIKHVRDNVSPFENDTPAKKDARIRRAKIDQEFFNQTYLPHYFTGKSPEFHREMEEMEAEGERQHRPVAIAAPRGFAKTTSITFAKRLKRSLYKEKKFIVIVGADETLASEITVSQRTELEHNVRIVHDFGKQKTGDWAQGDFVTTGGTRHWARGKHQRIRGEKHGPHRPDDIVLEDLEDDELVENPKRVKALLKWVREAVYPSLEPKVGLMSWVGTVLATRSALAQVLKDPAWITRIFRAIEDAVWNEELREFTAGISLWHERFPLSELSSIRRVVGSAAFSQEYQNEPRDDEAKIKDVWIKRVPFDLIDKERLFYFQALDPSLGENETSDFQGHATVARLPAGKLCVRHADIKKRSIDGMVKACYLLQQRFTAVGVGVETIGFQKLLKRDFDRAAKDEGRYLPIVPIPHHGIAKLPRILRLSPLIENGILTFASGPENEVGDMSTMIDQFLDIEKDTVHDDGPDSAEMASTLAEGLVGGKPSYEQVAQREAHFGAGAW